MLVDIDDPQVGRFTFARSTPHVAAAPEISKQPAPELGQHTREILEGILGYSAAELDSFAADNVIGLPG
jgi:crotonobetainyl-CoA:carnitine CoA-transferase CaiB-like acyl-CoA transferase